MNHKHKFRCFVCQELMNVPHEARCCKKRFCEDCIEKSLNQATWFLGPRCPNCKKRNFEYYENAYAKEEIDGLLITCRYSETTQMFMPKVR